MVLSEGTTEKIPSDTTGDRSRDRRLVAQRLNHYATPAPTFHILLYYNMPRVTPASEPLWQGLASYSDAWLFYGIQIAHAWLVEYNTVASYMVTKNWNISASRLLEQKLVEARKQHYYSAGCWKIKTN